MAVTMATVSHRTWWRHDGMRPLKFRPNRSTGRRFTAFSLFSNMAVVCHLECQKISIWSCDCHRLPNLLLCTKFHWNRITLPASRRP